MLRSQISTNPKTLPVMNFNAVLEVHSTFCISVSTSGYNRCSSTLTRALSEASSSSGTRAPSLRNDGPGVHAFVNQVDRATGQRRPGCQHVSMSVSAGKMRQKEGGC